MILDFATPIRIYTPPADAAPVVLLGPMPRAPLFAAVAILLLAVPPAIAACGGAADGPPAHTDSIASPLAELVCQNPAVSRGRALQPGPRELPDSLPRGRVSGSFDLLVLLIEFQDVKHSSSNAPARFASQLFNQTPGASSVYAYYVENSYGALKVVGTVTAVWYLSDSPMAEYGADGVGVDDRNGPVYRLVTEAVGKADADIDFGRFDHNGDGYIDHLCVVHAGQGQESSANSDCIWSHKWYDYDEPKVDGVVAGPYTMLSEFSPVGTFAHELGHDMGLPDLYDYGMDTYGAGVWDLMATGSWADNGNTPVHLSAWCKMKLGWLAPVDLTGTADNISLLNIERSAAAFRIWIEPPSEYFLIENREKTGWDEHLPAGGMLIWHIDERQKNNDDQDDRLVDLEEMDEAANGDSPVQPTDPWHESEPGFNPYSVPSTAACAGYNTAWYVYRIGPSGQTMKFCVKCMDVDMAVVSLDFVIFMPEKVLQDIRAVVRNDGGKGQRDIPVNAAISRGEVFFSQSMRIPSLAPGEATVLTWRWTPPKAGNYILTVWVDQDGDGVPFNDEKTDVLRVTTILFFDDVENGTGGWESRASVPLVPGLWHIVNRTDKYGDCASPEHSWWCGFDTTGKYTRGSQFTYYYLESPVIDLTRVDAAGLSFRLRYDISSGLPSGRLADTAIVEASANLGSSWTQLDSFTGAGGNWSVKMYDISGFTQSLFCFRFVLKSNFLMMGRGAYVDDIAVFASGNIYDVALGLAPNLTATGPGIPAYFNLTVNNAGNRQDTYELVCEAPGALTVSMNRTSLTLGLFETGKVLVVARITGNAEAGSLLVFKITAVSRGNYHVTSAVMGSIAARQVYGLSLGCDYPSILAGPGTDAVFQVNLTNSGNGRDTVAITPEGKWAACATVGATNMSLSPWETAALEVRLSVPGNATAGSELAFCLTVRSLEGASEHLALKAVVDRVSGARLEALDGRRPVRPGGTARFEVLLMNLGNGDEELILSSEAPKGWVVAHETAVALAPFSETRLQVGATVPENITGGANTFLLRASVAGGNQANLTLVVEVIMPDVFVAQMGVSPEIVDEGGATTLHFSIGNKGTDNASAVTVTLYDNGKRTKFWDLGTLAPGYLEDKTLRLHLGRGNHMLSVVASTPDRELASSNNEAQAESRVRASSSFIPGFGPAVLAAAVLALVFILPLQRPRS
jgi:M6 family metalloprotease-like protein